MTDEPEVAPEVSSMEPVVGAEVPFDEVAKRAEQVKDSATGRFVKQESAVAVAERPKIVHPALRKKEPVKRVSGKMRRTTVRSVKLAGYTTDGSRYVGQFPIEPSFNNGGNLTDPSAPLRFYLDQGLEWPHECDDLQDKYPGIVCAVLDCWDQALVNADPVRGTERCIDHEAMWQRKEIRYATSAKV